jgi:hypothetical protein
MRGILTPPDGVISTRVSTNDFMELAVVNVPRSALY